MPAGEPNFRQRRILFSAPGLRALKDSIVLFMFHYSTCRLKFIDIVLRAFSLQLVKGQGSFDTRTRLQGAFPWFYESFIRNALRSNVNIDQCYGHWRFVATPCGWWDFMPFWL
jgi:hypothetical protein